MSSLTPIIKFLLITYLFLAGPSAADTTWARLSSIHADYR